jgi:pimeloyl-ACP methyl ester carboxylesterase
VRLDAAAYPPDPSLALGVDYEDVTVVSPLGALPAWFVPGERDTWVLFVHGKGSSRAEALRALKATSEAGYPGLAISYRNDPGAPLSASGRYDYGASEWEDLDSAIVYAKTRGARRVVLVGFSMGGSIVLSLAARSQHMADVAGIILDSPVLSLERVLSYHGAAGHMPAPVVQLTKDLICSRFGVDWATLDYRAAAETIGVPLCIIHGVEDTVIPVEHSREHARARSELIDLVEVPNARHVGSWNIAPEKYERLVVEFVHRAAKRC